MKHIRMGVTGTLTGIAVSAMMALSAAGPANAAVCVPPLANGVALQGVLDGITTTGPSSVNVTTDCLSDTNDSAWLIGGSGGSVQTIVIELAGFANGNTFGIYDTSSPGTTVQVFPGAAGSGSQGLVSILADGSVIVNLADTGIDFAGNNFGFYLDSQVNQPGVGLWHSDTSLNSDGFDHMLAYQGVGDTIQILPFAAGPWASNEYILAFEDLTNGGDKDFTDFVVLVESVSPVPVPPALALFGTAIASIFGFGVVRRRRSAAAAA